MDKSSRSKTGAAFSTLRTAVVIGFVLLAFSFASVLAALQIRAYPIPIQTLQACPNPWTGGLANELGWVLTWSTAGDDGIRITDARYLLATGWIMSHGSVPLILVDYDSGTGVSDQPDELTPNLASNCEKYVDPSGKFIDVRALYLWPVNLCGYRTYTYFQHWVFWDDGRVDAIMEIWGPGFRVGFNCGADTAGHSYHVWWRLDWDLDGADNDAYRYANPANTWNTANSESFHRVVNSNPNPSLDVLDCISLRCYQGTLSPQEGDLSTNNACILRFHTGEEDIGRDCSGYVTGENVLNTDIVLWYDGQKRWEGALYTQYVHWSRIR